MIPLPAIRRYHSLDSLRATMMLLGLVLHSAINYATVPSSVWSFKDASTSWVFDFVLFFIHAFRMPVFFLIAGFFAAFLYYRRGGAGMMKNRVSRVLLPMVAAWVVLVPIIMSGFIYATPPDGLTSAEAVKQYFQGGNLYGPPITLMHLWFLWNLMIFYVGAIAVMQVIKRLPEHWRQRGITIFTRIMPTPIGLMIMIVITTMTLLPMSYAGLDTDVSLLPAPRILVAYGVFIAWGWMLFNARELVEGFGRRAWLWMISGTVAGILYYLAVFGTPLFESATLNHVFGCLLCSATVWLLAYGFIGIWVRYFDQPSPLGRYLADASYWLYLIHLPFTIWIPALISGLAWPAGAKFMFVLTATTVISLVTYHYAVRPTVIGQFLNGRKYPRGLPEYDESGAYITK